VAIAAAAVGVVAGAAALEGGTVPAFGGSALAAMAALSALVAWTQPTPLPSRLGRIGLALVALTLIWQVAPIPTPLRALVAPGQAAWLAQVAPEWVGDVDRFLDALARYDVLAAIGGPPPWDWDLLAGAEASRPRPGALHPSAWPWAAARLVGAGLCVVVGMAIGRSEPAIRTWALLLLLVGLVEAVLGVAWRDGNTTGIGVKTAYLGSATGTLVNRGHYGSLLILALGAAWGLGAALFPLVPEEVRRHRARQRRSSQPPSVFEVSGDKLPRLVLLAFAAGLVGIGLVASQSRGPVVAFGLASVGVGLWAWRRRDERFHLAIGLGLPLVSGALAAVGFGLRGAFGRFGSLLQATDVSVESRLQVWREGFAAFLDAPVFGAGAGAWRLAHGVHVEGVALYDFHHAHSGPVEQLVELGAVGATGLFLLLVAWARAVRAGLDVADHGVRTSVGVGSAVAVVAVLLQSLFDFPLHTPAVLLGTAVSAGVALGALSDPPTVAVPTPVPLFVAALVAAGAGSAALADAAHPGTRDERLGERPAILFQDWPDDEAGRLAFHAAASAGAARAPLDPWAQVALGIAEGRLAQVAAGTPSPGGAVEQHAYAAELAVARALRLRPREPRLHLAVARVLLGLASTGYPDARKERAVELLVGAVKDDPWRARDAFELGRGLSAEALTRIAQAAPPDGAHRARVLYELGRAWDARRELGPAARWFDAALEADPGYGPALYARASVARAQGQDDLAESLLRRFLVAKERPGGMEGWALLHLGDLEAAEARLRRTVSESPTNTWAWEGLAQVAARRGDAETERSVWRSVLAYDPAYARAKERLRALGEAPTGGEKPAP